MKRIRRLLGIICIALFPQVVLANAAPPSACNWAGSPTLTPPNPGPGERIGIALSVPSSDILHTFTVYDYYWVKATVGSTTFAVDLILTNDATASFAGYTLVDK